ncbi:dienelactone hydrolase family protein [Azospira restricta]|uniref:Alpha/beta hydrolase n=1 Tax=Azospira restricta TaxID=404405 RepID=A0A974SPE4_9RHOO|nr:alpha/beta hydrolase [Azospira restricta]QRJ63974.1 alpha/beta hydrolase [Azospira restricta]
MSAPCTEVSIPAAGARLPGTLALPPAARGLVVFAHGSGSSRLSPRNVFVAEILHGERIATLLFDLLTPDEDVDYAARFDIALLTERLLLASDWLAGRSDTAGLALGYFGASTGAAAALQAAARRRPPVAAVVSRGGRPDLAGAEALAAVASPTLLIVGGDDETVLDLNRQALALLACDKRLVVVPGATHLFEEPGTLAAAARHAADWFVRCFA